MGRKVEPGISYYRMNCGHTLNRKVRLLINEFDSDGYWVWQCILAEGYGTRGYYFDAGVEDELEVFASDTCKKPVELVKKIITCCLRRGLFDKRLFEEHKILTCEMMQEVYLDATAERRRKGTIIEIEENYMVGSIPENTRNISIIPSNKQLIPRNNDVNPGNIPRQNPQSRVEKSRVKESKVPLIGEAPAMPADPPQVKGGKMKEKQDALLIRNKIFSDSLTPFLPTYGKELIRAFFNHWSEPNKSRTKMKFELEETWDVGRRLVTWEANEIRWNKGGKGTGTPSPKPEKAIPTLSKVQTELNYLFERYLEAPDLLTVISLGAEHYNQLKSSGLLAFTEGESEAIIGLAVAYMAEKKIDVTPESELLFKKKFGVLEYFKQLQAKGQQTIFHLAKPVENEAI